MARTTALQVNARQVYYGSNGGATRSFCVRLEKCGQLGRVAAALFRAQKASARAKVYHGGIHRRDGGWDSYRELACERKAECLGKLCWLLEEDDCGLQWGWKPDLSQSYARQVLYVDLPVGQVSFHSTARFSGPDYPGDWDGEHKSEQRILECADRVLSDKHAELSGESLTKQLGSHKQRVTDSGQRSLPVETGMFT